MSVKAGARRAVAVWLWSTLGYCGVPRSTSEYFGVPLPAAAAAGGGAVLQAWRLPAAWRRRRRARRAVAVRLWSTLEYCGVLRSTSEYFGVPLPAAAAAGGGAVLQAWRLPAAWRRRQAAALQRVGRAAAVAVWAEAVAVLPAWQVPAAWRRRAAALQRRAWRPGEAVAVAGQAVVAAAGLVGASSGGAGGAGGG